MQELLPLSLLRPGESARIAELIGGPEEVHRLEELGLRSGSEITMIQPGCPCILRLGGQRLCFRANELTHVLVQMGAVA